MGITISKEEYPPLLVDGFHEKSLSEIRKICVSDFKLSSTRSTIMNGFEQIVNGLNTAKIPGYIWLDGSFVTEKINPADCDFILSVPEEFANSASDDQKNLISIISWNLKDTLKCDSYYRVCECVGPGGLEHELKTAGYWTKLFGRSRAGVPKGIILHKLES